MRLPKDVKSGPATKSDTAAMKSQAAERNDYEKFAYEQGKEDAAQTASSSSGGGGSGRAAKLSFSNDAQTVILITMTITGLVSVIENIHAVDKSKTIPIIRIVVGTFVSGALLLAMSYAVPEFASGLSIVAMTATILDRGKPFWESVSQVTMAPAVQNSLLPPRTGSDYPATVNPPTGPVGPVGPVGPGGPVPVNPIRYT